MFSHDSVWAALDALAARYSLTTSGLARKAGLDPTTFNKSKRYAQDGRARWPSTESIAKVIEATGASFEEFTELISGNEHPFLGEYIQPAKSIPLLGKLRKMLSMRLKFQAIQCCRFIATVTH